MPAPSQAMMTLEGEYKGAALSPWRSSLSVSTPSGFLPSSAAVSDDIEGAVELFPTGDKPAEMLRLLEGQNPMVECA